jgi:hypothetical protein
MRGAARGRYRVYTQDEFFAEDGLLAADEPASDKERGAPARRPIDLGRARRARRAAGFAMLIGAGGAVAAMIAIDSLPHAGSSRRRGTLSPAARDVARVTSTPARPLSRARLPRALARQSRRGGRAPHLGRERVKSAASQSPVNRPSLDERTASRPVPVPAGRDEVARVGPASPSDVPPRRSREEFGFER